MNLIERLRDKGFWYTPHGKDRPMRHKVAAEAADEIDRLKGVLRNITELDYSRSAVNGAMFKAHVFAETALNFEALSEDN